MKKNIWMFCLLAGIMAAPVVGFASARLDFSYGAEEMNQSLSKVKDSVKILSQDSSNNFRSHVQKEIAEKNLLALAHFANSTKIPAISNALRNFQKNNFGEVLKDLSNLDKLQDPPVISLNKTLDDLLKDSELIRSTNAEVSQDYSIQSQKTLKALSAVFASDHQVLPLIESALSSLNTE
jgi:hypothetical protein